MGWWKCFGTRWRKWLHNIVNVLCATELFTLKRLIFFYVNFTPTNCLKSNQTENSVSDLQFRIKGNPRDRNRFEPCVPHCQSSGHMTQESSGKKGSVPGVTWHWKTGSHKGCDFSLLSSSIHLLLKKQTNNKPICPVSLPMPSEWRIFYSNSTVLAK